VRDAAVIIAIAAIASRTTQKYRSRRLRYVAIAARHAAQNILHQAISLGLGGIPIGAFSDLRWKAALQLRISRNRCTSFQSDEPSLARPLCAQERLQASRAFPTRQSAGNSICAPFQRPTLSCSPICTTCTRDRKTQCQTGCGCLRSAQSHERAFGLTPHIVLLRRGQPVVFLNKILRIRILHRNSTGVQRTDRLDSSPFVTLFYPSAWALP
jgi:hypothetical protein